MLQPKVLYKPKTIFSTITNIHNSKIMTSVILYFDGFLESNLKLMKKNMHSSSV